MDDKLNFNEYRKTSTVKAKLFCSGDEDGFLQEEGYTLADVLEDKHNGCIPKPTVPYIRTLENQFHRGEFGKHYVCIGINGERWLVEKNIFEKTYEIIK